MDALAEASRAVAESRCRGLYCRVLAMTPGSRPIGSEPNRIEVMQSVLKYATTLAAIGVFLVLLAGFWNMMRGSNPNLSQKLMRWRVGLQFLAIMIAMILVYWLRP